MRAGSTKNPRLPENYLRLAYLVEGMSTRQIAAEAHVSASSVMRDLRWYDIPRRTKSEALSGDSNPMYGKSKSEESRRKISETLRRTNLDPVVRARRSLASSGTNNPMHGRTHTPEVKEAARQRLVILRKTVAFRKAHQKAMARPKIRQSLSEAASRRVGHLNPFFGRKHTEETKRLLSEANRGRFQGENGSNWKGGRTRIALLVRSSTPYTEWRTAIFERDDFTCKSCGKRGGPLNADHHPVAFATLLRDHRIRTIEDSHQCAALWDIDNGRTLCVGCHRKTPNYGWRSSGNKT